MRLGERLRLIFFGADGYARALQMENAALVNSLALAHTEINSWKATSIHLQQRLDQANAELARLHRESFNQVAGTA